MAVSGGVMFAGLGVREGAAVAMSTNSGASWTNASLANERVYAFLTVNQDVYATGLILNEDAQTDLRRRGATERLVGIHQYDGKMGFRPRNDLGPAQLFPGVSIMSNPPARIARPIASKDHAAYIGAYCHNDHQYMPFGAFYVDSLQEGHVSIRPIRKRPVNPATARGVGV